MVERRRAVHGRAGIRPTARRAPRPSVPGLPERQAGGETRASRGRSRVRGSGRSAARKDAARGRRGEERACAAAGVRCGSHAGGRPVDHAEPGVSGRRRRTCRPQARLGPVAAAPNRAVRRFVRARARGGGGPDAGRRLRVARVRDDPEGHLRDHRPRADRLPDRASRRAPLTLDPRRPAREVARAPWPGRPPRGPRRRSSRPVPDARVLAAGVRPLGRPAGTADGAARTRLRSSQHAHRPATESAWRC